MKICNANNSLLCWPYVKIGTWFWPHYLCFVTSKKCFQESRLNPTLKTRFKPCFVFFLGFPHHGFSKRASSKFLNNVPVSSKKNRFAWQWVMCGARKYASLIPLGSTPQPVLQVPRILQLKCAARLSKRPWRQQGVFSSRVKFWIPLPPLLLIVLGPGSFHDHEKHTSHDPPNLHILGGGGEGGGTPAPKAQFLTALENTFLIFSSILKPVNIKRLHTITIRFYKTRHLHKTQKPQKGRSSAWTYCPYLHTPSRKSLCRKWNFLHTLPLPPLYGPTLGPSDPPWGPYMGEVHI